MKLAAIAAVMAAAFLAAFSGVATAQIPVTDSASIIDRGIKHVESIAKSVEQIGKMQSQLDQMKQQYTSMTGTRNLGEIFNNPQLREYLPKEWQAVYDKVRDGGSEGLTGDAAKIFSENRVFDMCAAMTDDTAKKSCQSLASKPAQDKANALAAIDGAKQRLTQIESLMKQINSTTDPKAVGELQARIGVEQAAISNEQTKLQLYAMAAQAEDRLQEQRQREINAKANARKGYAKLPGVQ